MPAAVAGFITAAVASAGVTSIVAAQIVYAAAYIATSAIISFGANLIIGALSKPKTPEIGGNFATQAGNRTVNIKQPVEPWSVVYGSVRKAGTYTFIGVSGSNNDFLHVVITLAGHRLSRIGQMYFDGEPVPLDENGEAIGKFGGFVKVEKNMGIPDQEAFPTLVNDAGDRWTEDHRQSGRAGVHVRLKYDGDLFANGVPAIAFDLQGKLVFDPRENEVAITSSAADGTGFARIITSSPHGLSQKDQVFIHGHKGSTYNLNGECYVSEVISSTEVKVFIGTSNNLGASGSGGQLAKMIFSENTDLCMADYLMNREFGRSYDYDIEISQSSLESAASIDDELVELNPENNNTDKSITIGNDGKITFTENFASLVNGNAVVLKTDGTLPGGLLPSTQYFWIYETMSTGYLATSLQNARKGVRVDFTADTGSGTPTLDRTHEARYTSNGTFKTDATAVAILEDMLTANGGKITLIGGLWRFIPAHYRPPSVELDEGDLRVNRYNVTTRFSARDSFNGVKGVYVNPENRWYPSDFPAVTNQLYIEQDQGERRWRDLDLAWTISSSTAQRLAKIDLERNRQEINIPALPCKMIAYKIQSTDTMRFTVDDFGWDRKVFDVSLAELVLEQDSSNVPVMGTNLTLQETAPEVYEWNFGEEQTIDPAPDSGLPNPFTVAPPTNLTFREELYVTTQGSGVKARVVISWDPSPDIFVSSYQPEVREVPQDGTPPEPFTVLPRVNDTTVTIQDVQPGIYEFRVKAINTIGVSSSYTNAVGEVRGLLERAAAPTGLTISTSGSLAILRWDQAPELDVRIGGEIDFRHSPVTVSPDINQTISIGQRLSGTDQMAVLPLRPGSYFVRFIDSSGIAGDAAFVNTDGATALDFVNLTTVVEDPFFTGDKTNVIFFDNSIRLGGASLMDDWGYVDDLPDWDFEGGVSLSGVYQFDSSIDLGEVKRFRIIPTVNSQVVNQLDLIDSRTTNIDEWDNFDGVAGTEADAELWVRTTLDDPQGPNPVWTSYERIDTSEHQARGVQAQLRMTTTDESYNIIITGLRLDLEEVTV